jgi:hypothetical protein
MDRPGLQTADFSFAVSQARSRTPKRGLRKGFYQRGTAALRPVRQLAQRSPLTLGQLQELLKRLFHGTHYPSETTEKVKLAPGGMIQQFLPLGIASLWGWRSGKDSR